MKMLATRPEWVIPGHDMTVFEKFPKVADGVVRIRSRCRIHYESNERAEGKKDKLFSDCDNANSADVCLRRAGHEV